MKQIIKSSEPQAFTTWKAQANAQWTPTWRKLQNPEKAAVRTSLLEEQGYVCCYCGQSIDETNSHIEHFIPGESDTSPHALEYDNLLESCQVSAKSKTTPNYCGVAHQNSTLPVSPLDSNVESRFRYDINGHVHPASADMDAQYTIDVLRLDREPLIGSRKAAIEGIVFDQEGVLVDEHDLKKILTILSQRDGAGKFLSFSHAICMATSSLAAR